MSVPFKVNAHLLAFVSVQFHPIFDRPRLKAVLLCEMTAAVLALRSERLLTDLNCPQVSTPVLSFIWTFMSRKLISDLSRLVFQFLRETPKKHSHRSLFFLPFVVFTLFGLKNARVFSKCFLSNI